MGDDIRINENVDLAMRHVKVEGKEDGKWVVID